MEAKNNVARIKELISLIKHADKAYYGEDDPVMTDKEYDDLIDELMILKNTAKGYLQHRDSAAELMIN